MLWFCRNYAPKERGYQEAKLSVVRGVLCGLCAGAHVRLCGRAALSEPAQPDWRNRAKPESLRDPMRDRCAGAHTFARARMTHVRARLFSPYPQSCGRTLRWEGAHTLCAGAQDSCAGAHDWVYDLFAPCCPSLFLLGEPHIYRRDSL